MPPVRRHNSFNQLNEFKQGIRIIEVREIRITFPEMTEPKSKDIYVEEVLVLVLSKELQSVKNTS